MSQHTLVYPLVVCQVSPPPALTRTCGCLGVGAESAAEAGKAEEAAEAADGLLSDAAFRDKHEIKVTGMAVPKPVQRFEDVALPECLQKAIRTAGYATPSAIQAQVPPPPRPPTSTRRCLMKRCDHTLAPQTSQTARTAVVVSS